MQNVKKLWEQKRCVRICFNVKKYILQKIILILIFLFKCDFFLVICYLRQKLICFVSYLQCNLSTRYFFTPLVLQIELYPFCSFFLEFSFVLYLAFKVFDLLYLFLKSPKYFIVIYL